MSGLDLAERMPQMWQTRPLLRVAGSETTGIAAVRMRVRGPESEVEGPVSDNHILSFVLSGERRHTIWHDGRLAFEGVLRSRSFNIVPAGAKPQAVVQNRVDVAHLYLPAAFVVEQAIQSEYFNTYEFTLLDPRCVADPVMEHIVQALLLANETGTPSRLFADSLGSAAADHVLRHHSSLASLAKPAFRRGGLAGWQVRRSEEFLREHLAKDISLAEIAEQARLSPFHFARQFKATMGLPPAAYQRKLRLEKAQELLLNTNLEIGEIAATVGYDTPQAFARAFRQAIGASPSDWRRERRR